MSKVNLTQRIISIGTAESPYPPSFGNSPWLYGSALAALICITVFGAIVACWMLRDLWRDRFIDHPFNIAFLFRSMVGVIAGTAFIRSVPEVAYMTLYGEVTASRLEVLMLFKRSADILALPFVVTWMCILVLIYPHMMLVLRDRLARSMVIIDPVNVWPRLVRSIFILLTVLVIAASIAAGKWALGYRGE